MSDGARGHSPPLGGLTTRLRFCLSYLSSLVADSVSADAGRGAPELPARTPPAVASLVAATVRATHGARPAPGVADVVGPPREQDPAPSMAVEPVQVREDPHFVVVTATSCSLHEEPQAMSRRPSEIVLTMEPHHKRLQTDVPPAAVISPALCTPSVALEPLTAIPAKRSAQPFPALPHKKLALEQEPAPVSRSTTERELVLLPDDASTERAADAPSAAAVAPRLCAPPVALAPATLIHAKGSAQDFPAIPNRRLSLEPEPEPAPASESTAERERVRLPKDASTERAADTTDEPVPPTSAEKMGNDQGSGPDADLVILNDSSGGPTAPARTAFARADSPDVTDATTMPFEPRADDGTDATDTGSDTIGEIDADDMVRPSNSALDTAVDPEDDVGRPKRAQAGRRPATIPGATLTQGSTTESDKGPSFIPPMLAARPPVGNERRYANFRVVDHPPVYCPWEINDSLSNSGRTDDESPTSPTASTRPDPEEPEPAPTPAAEPPPAEPSPPCGLCPQYDSGDMSPFPMIRLRLRRSFGRPAKQMEVHRECAEWAPEVYWENEDELVNVDKAYARGRRLRCAVCSTLGATIGCHVDACRLSFHLRCLKLGNCTVDDDAYAVFCEAHVDEATPALYRSATGAWGCRVQQD